MRSSFGLVVLLVPTIISDIPGQVSAPSRNLERIRATEVLRDSQVVRTFTAELGRLEGRVLQRADTLVILLSQSQSARVPIASIDSLWVQGNNLGRGALWGAGLGTLAGAAFGVFINAAFCQDADSGCQDDDLTVIGSSTVLGVLTGTAVGAVVGALTSNWQRRWPR